MYCENCGAVVDSWYKFCKECGCNLANNTVNSDINNIDEHVDTPNNDITLKTIENSTKSIETNKPSAWQRLFARCTDLTLELLAAAFLVYYVLAIYKCYESAHPPVIALVSDIIIISIALVLDALIYKICGNTLGKKIFSIKIADSKNNPLTAMTYLKRNFSILPYCYFYWMGHALPEQGIYWWLYVLELALPWASLIAAAWQYQKMEKGGETSYDDKSQYHVFYAEHSVLKKRFAHIFFFILLAMWLYLHI